MFTEIPVHTVMTYTPTDELTTDTNDVFRISSSDGKTQVSTVNIHGEWVVPSNPYMSQSHPSDILTITSADYKTHVERVKSGDICLQRVDPSITDVRQDTVTDGDHDSPSNVLTITSTDSNTQVHTVHNSEDSMEWDSHQNGDQQDSSASTSITRSDISGEVRVAEAGHMCGHKRSNNGEICVERVRSAPPLRSSGVPGSFRGDMDQCTGMAHKEACLMCLFKMGIPIMKSDDIEIQREEDGSENEIGSGRFGRVILGKMKSNSKLVAVKQILKATSFRAKIQEAKILKHLEDTQTVPKLYGVICDPDSETFMLVQEYFAEGFTLYDLLKSPDLLPDRLHWICLCYQLVKGLQAIHEKRVLLNDIKINNVLIDMKTLRLRYIDLGHASFKNGHAFRTKLPDIEGYAYIAPEFRNGFPSSVKSDTFSLCFMMCQICRVLKYKRLVAVAIRGITKEPVDRPSLGQLKAKLGRLLYEC